MQIQIKEVSTEVVLLKNYERCEQGHWHCYAPEEAA